MIRMDEKKTFKERKEFIESHIRPDHILNSKYSDQNYLRTVEEIKHSKKKPKEDSHSGS